MLAAHLVITLLAGAGIRLVCEFLQLSGLGPFVATSYGSQHKTNAALQEAAVAYAEEQQQQARQVVRALGEAYHPYDLRTGQAQPVEQVAERFQDCGHQLSTLAKQADLLQRVREASPKPNA